MSQYICAVPMYNEQHLIEANSYQEAINTFLPKHQGWWWQEVEETSPFARMVIIGPKKNKYYNFGQKVAYGTSEFWRQYGYMTQAEAQSRGLL